MKFGVQKLPYGIACAILISGVIQNFAGTSGATLALPAATMSTPSVPELAISECRAAVVTKFEAIKQEIITAYRKDGYALYERIKADYKNEVRSRSRELLERLRSGETVESIAATLKKPYVEQLKSGIENIKIKHLALYNAQKSNLQSEWHECTTKVFLDEDFSYDNDFGIEDDELEDTLCGNGVVDAGEECDIGRWNGQTNCTTECTILYCGDAIVSTLIGEECDDGNTNDADACSNNCFLNEEAETTISLENWPSQKFHANQVNAVLAKIIIKSTTSDSINSLKIALDTLNQTGIQQIRNVRLFHPDSGAIYQALPTPVNTVQGTQIYHFTNLPQLSSEVHWQLEADFVDAVSPAPISNIQASICAGNQAAIGACTQNFFPEVEPSNTIATQGSMQSNVHQIIAPSLHIITSDSISNDTVVANQDGVVLYEFTAIAGELEDVLLTGATFGSALEYQGEQRTTTPNNQFSPIPNRISNLDNASNYTLWVDTNKDNEVDTIIESGVAPTTSFISMQKLVTFNSLTGGGFIIPANESVTFQVRADIVGNVLEDNRIALKFATSGRPDGYSIDAEVSESGISLNQIVNSRVYYEIQDYTKYTIVRGNLYVTQDSTPTRSRQVLGGEVSEPVLRMNLRAENEPIQVNQLRFTALGENLYPIRSLELYINNSETPFGSALQQYCDDYLVSEGTAFCFSNFDSPLVVSEDTDVDILVRARMKTDTMGAESGSDFRVQLPDSYSALTARGLNAANIISYSDYNGSANGEFFIGASNADANEGADIEGEKQYVVLAKITGITNANPAADNTAVPSGVSPVGQFTITAANHNNSENGLNDVAIDSLQFTIDASNVTHSDYTLYNKADPSIGTSCQVSGLNVLCKNLIDSPVNIYVDPGESQTFVLKANIQSVGPNASYQVSLKNLNNPADVGSVIWYDSESKSDANLIHWVDITESEVRSTMYRSN